MALKSTLATGIDAGGAVCRCSEYAVNIKNTIYSNEARILLQEYYCIVGEWMILFVEKNSRSARLGKGEEAPRLL